MASFLNFYLDLVAPASVTLTAPANSGSVNILARGDTTDAVTSGYTMKFWGVGVTTNAVAGATEVLAPALPYDELDHTITFASEGAKTLYFAVYDPVGNKSNEATANINITTSLPTITIDNITTGYAPNLPGNDAGRFSIQTGKRTLSFRISPNIEITEWKVLLVQSTGALNNDAGNQVIGTTNGSTVGAVETILAGAYKNITIDMRDLPSVTDGAKIVKVFGKNLAGNWSEQ